MHNDFQFNEKANHYEGELYSLKVKIQPAFMSEETVLFAQQICARYQEQLKALVQFCLTDDGFTSFYGPLSEQELLANLGEPIVNVYDDGGKLTYLEHQLDDDHIIDVEFYGVLDEFTEVVVDG